MSAIQGFPSNQKVNLGSGLTNNFATVLPTDPNRSAVDTHTRFIFRVNLAPLTAGATTGLQFQEGTSLFWVEDAATKAHAGDIFRAEDGAAQYLEIPIVKVETNRFLLAVNSGLLPASGDTFYILRYATQRVDETGSQIVIASPGPSQFVLDGVDVEVEEDTVIPANSKPFPVKALDGNGVEVDFATEATSQAILAAISAQDYASDYSDSIRLDYSVTNVTDSAWVELLPNSGPEVFEITLFDGGGFAMELGFGAAASEVRKLLIPPGGFNGKFTFHIPANTRLSIRAVGAATVSAGEIDINLFV